MLGIFTAVAIIIIISLFLFYAYFIETKQISVEQVRLRLKNIKGRYTCMHLSDFHLFKNMSSSRLNKMKSMIDLWVKKKKPDFIFITGDFIDNNSGIEMLIPFLSGLKSRYGIFGVMGNHDYFQYNFLHIFYPFFFFNEKKEADVKTLKKVLNEAGVKLLIDETYDMKIKKDKIKIVGIDTRSLKNKSFLKIKYEKEKILTLLLSHYPEVINYYKGKADVVLAGHTHGGQITAFGVPLVIKSEIKRKEARGISIHNGTILSISKGLGVSRYIPFRFFAKPDFIIMELIGD